MKHSSSGETQQEAYEVLQIDLAFADMKLNYTFSQSSAEGEQLWHRLCESVLPSQPS